MPRRMLKLKSLFVFLVLLLLATGTAHATFPGRNGLIAFQAQGEAGIQIFTIRPSGQELRQITHVIGDAVAPDWSPDGRQIVFEQDVPNAGANVAIMNADGTGLVELVSDPTVFEDDPSFTPDGSRIVFHRFDPATNDEACWSMDRNGNGRQRIGFCSADPNVSPEAKSSASSAPTGSQAESRSLPLASKEAIFSKSLPTVSMSRLSRTGRRMASAWCLRKMVMFLYPACQQT